MTLPPTRTEPGTQPIRFFHRGAVVEIDGAHPTRSVLDWLREDARCTGTKEGCNEGDCGACTVVVGELAASDDSQAVGGLALKTVNACLQFLPTLHGKALFVVDDLKGLAGGALHPAQQAMVDCHGSQCGFCTPGFVMSMWHGYTRHQACGTRPSRPELADALAGNLCRCTGYRPILDAAERMFELPAVPFDAAPVVAALQSLRTAGGLHYAAASRHRPGPARTDHFHAPDSLDALASLRASRPEARLLAGGTDVGLWVTKQFRDLGEVIYLGDVPELQQIEERADAELWIGAGVSLERAFGALVQRWPSLRDAWVRFASPPIRHAGTLGGNVANGSPIGDSPPVLMALGAQVELRLGTDVRRLPLDRFYLGYMKNAMQPGEFVQAVVVPRDTSFTVRAYKISKRFDSDISAVFGAFALTLDGGTVCSARLAFGGMAAKVARAAQTEAAITDQPWTAATVQAAQQALAQDFQPLSDMRASAAYRLQVAQNLLMRLWLETRPDGPLPDTAVHVGLANGALAKGELAKAMS